MNREPDSKLKTIGSLLLIPVIKLLTLTVRAFTALIPKVKS